MVNFCNFEFGHWLVNPETSEQRKELFDIFGSIFSKEKNEDYQLSQPCGVLGYVTNDPFKSFTIDKGSEDGILVVGEFIDFSSALETEGFKNVERGFLG